MSGRVIVGVDGSENARKAVRWAAREAKLRGMKLELVSAWEILIYSYAYGYGFGPAISEEMMKSLTERAEGHLAEALDEARAEAREVQIETIAVEGQPAKVLVEVAKGADLLVVGSRGLGGFRELLLGSVSQQCATRHVPGRDRETPGGGRLSNWSPRGLRSPPASATALGASARQARSGSRPPTNSRFVIAPRRAAPHHRTRRPQLARGADAPRSWRSSGNTALNATPSAVTCGPFLLPSPASDYRRADATLAWPRIAALSPTSPRGPCRWGSPQRRGQCLEVSYRFRAQEALVWLSRLAIAATTMSARKSSPPITVSAIVITSTYKCATPPPDRHRPKVTHRGGHSASEAIAAPVNVTLVTSGRRGPDDPPPPGRSTEACPGAATYRGGRR